MLGVLGHLARTARITAQFRIVTLAKARLGPSLRGARFHLDRAG